jgi:hypothetical protein
MQGNSENSIKFRYFGVAAEVDEVAPSWVDAVDFGGEGGVVFASSVVDQPVGVGVSFVDLP